MIVWIVAMWKALWGWFVAATGSGGLAAAVFVWWTKRKGKASREKKMEMTMTQKLELGQMIPFLSKQLVYFTDKFEECDRRHEKTLQEHASDRKAWHDQLQECRASKEQTSLANVLLRQENTKLGNKYAALKAQVSQGEPPEEEREKTA